MGAEGGGWGKEGDGGRRGMGGGGRGDMEFPGVLKK